jgi:PRTRC genetic system ThiF family protein
LLSKQFHILALAATVGWTITVILGIESKKAIVLMLSQNPLLNPYDPIDMILVGCGGTGCQILTGLAKINHAVKALGHRTGLRVITVAPDTVSPSNIGRQTFSPVDINSNKARIFTETVNRWYGTDWLHIPELFNDSIFLIFLAIS